MSELNLLQKLIYQQALRLMPYVFWTLVAIVGVFMLVELSPKEDGLKYLDKIQHALIFFILSVSGCLAFKKKTWIVTLGLAIFGAIIEVLQAALTTTRTGDVYDWLADVAGILIGFMIIFIYRQFKPKPLQ
ncbi:MAG: VanZ family protein [Methylotenera sp.]